MVKKPDTKPIKNILVPLDGSKSSIHVLKETINLGKCRLKNYNDFLKASQK